MSDYQIRLGSTDSVNSVDKDNFLGVQLKNTSKKIHYNDIKATVDQYELFMQERMECTRYRLILTINPYCTNVLFNPLTEIVKNEGNVGNNNDERYYNNEKKLTNGIDDSSTPKRVQMIANTEYSKPLKENDTNSGYTYLPGYDIFDNHILRDMGFTVVEANKVSTNNQYYNTLADTERYSGSDHDVVEMYKRKNISTKPTKVKKHAHNYDDTLSFEDSVNANLTEENGWFGFSNVSNLKTTDVKGKLSEISCVINNRKNCEFIEMYPDSSLYSFTPKYNSFMHRLEQNWDVFLTYPCSNDYCHQLVGVENSTLNALAILTAKTEKGLTGEDIIVFRTYTKHNLKRGDNIKLYDIKPVDDGVKTDMVGTFIVNNVGNGSTGNKDYYFYIDALNFDSNFVSGIDKKELRFKKTYNGMDSMYYVRMHKKLGDYAVERYKLAFASTIYNDDTTQLTFTDTIDIDGLTDNLGRPVTEIFATIIKTNKGNKDWYDGKNDENIEFSHCFGKITAGYELSHEKADKAVIDATNNEYAILKKREWMHDARVINNSNHFKSQMPQINPEKKEEGGITMFYGDVVEYSAEDCMEHVLADSVYRFNTYQREHPTANEFIYHEIKFDDYDSDEYAVEKIENGNNIRNEGYFYKAHYPFKVRGFGGLNQAGHNGLKIADVKPVRANKIYLKVRCTLPTHLSVNDTVYLCDDKNNKMFDFTCIRVESPTTFFMHPKDKTWKEFSEKTTEVYGGEFTLNWLKVSGMLKNGLLKLRGKNPNIPSFAFNAGNNTYLWRDVLPYGEITEDEVPEYSYANNALYITPTIRFYLKRQDPDNSIGLYTDDKIFPNDIHGNIKKVSNYYYEETPTDEC